MNSGRRRSIAATLAAVVMMIAITATCQNAAAQQTLELTVDGTQRAARVYPGRRTDAEPSPLVIVFHGLGDSARNFANAVKFHQAWPEATVVYPKGKPRDDRDGMNGWHGFRDNDENHDLDFVDALLEELPKRYKVDPQRVYVAGFSNGGHLTFNLLLDRPCSFAAFAPVGALAAYVSEADVARPVIYLFGRDEPRKYSEAWQQTVVAIAHLNRASGEKKDWAPGFTEFVAGPSGEPTVYSLYGAGHIWPASGTESIIRFFREHKLYNSCN